jgi:hypothetical protein
MLDKTVSRDRIELIARVLGGRARRRSGGLVQAREGRCRLQSRPFTRPLWEVRQACKELMRAGEILVCHAFVKRKHDLNRLGLPVPEP